MWLGFFPVLSVLVFYMNPLNVVYFLCALFFVLFYSKLAAAVCEPFAFYEPSLSLLGDAGMATLSHNKVLTIGVIISPLRNY